MKKEEEIKAITKHDLVIHTITHYERGLMAKTYELETDRGIFVFKEYLRPQEQLLNIIKKQNFFSSEIEQVPQIIKYGEMLSENNPFIIMEEKKGKSIADRVEEVNEQTISTMHGIMNTFHQTPLSRINTMYEQTHISQADFYKKIEELIKKTNYILEKNQSSFLVYAKKIKEKIANNPLLHSNKNLKSFIHNDLSAENILVEYNDISGVLDFDSSQVGDSLYDKHYFLCHLSQYGAEDKIIKQGSRIFFPEISEEVYQSGLLTSQFVALQPVMNLKKRIEKNPSEKQSLVQKTKNALESFLDCNQYEELLR